MNTQDNGEHAAWTRAEGFELRTVAEKWLQATDALPTERVPKLGHSAIIYEQFELTHPSPTLSVFCYRCFSPARADIVKQCLCISSVYVNQLVPDRNTF